MNIPFNSNGTIASFTTGDLSLVVYNKDSTDDFFTDETVGNSRF